MTVTQTPNLPLHPIAPTLWRPAAPRHFDSAWPRWLKFAVMLLLLAAAFLFLDQPLAQWAFNHNPLEKLGSDIQHELMMLEQFGQWTCGVLVIAAVALIDRAGRRKAFAMALACLITVALCYLFKGLFGRPRPDTLPTIDAWRFLGPTYGFTGTHYESFPSAHTTGAFALACALAWFYPRARGLFIALACITAAQRVLHHAHYLSDTIAAILLSVTVTRLVLNSTLPARLINLFPTALQQWFLKDSAPEPRVTESRI